MLANIFSNEFTVTLKQQKKKKKFKKKTLGEIYLKPAYPRRHEVEKNY